MMLALLPLAIATIIANWHSIQTTEHEKQELLIAATDQNAGQLAAHINAIRTAQSLTANVLARHPESDDICGRLQQLFQAMADKDGLLVTLFDQDGRSLCQAIQDPRLTASIGIDLPDGPDTLLVPDLEGLLIRSRSADRKITALALYLRPALSKLTGDKGQTVILQQGAEILMLTPASAQPKPGRQRLNAGAVVSADPSGRYNLLLKTQVADTLSTNARLISLFMPLLLWVAAVFLGWLVVHGLLIQPLAMLRREVAAYVPGEILHPPQFSRFASREMTELGETFHAMSRDIARHEEGMKAALERQMRLTREVHHRVKNNLQVISSLISLHWRAAPDPQSSAAYLSIQRRVDALAVVQRNHYAEQDEEQGLRARPVMNEIASALKISAKVQSGCNIEIAVDCDDVTLHQDVATAIAFMTAELADLVIALDPAGRFAIALIRLEDDPWRARFSLVAPIFRHDGTEEPEPFRLYERVLTGLARQLRTPLGYDAEQGEYHITISLTG
ncbi:MAG: sensor histidine kinase [Sphingobium sp.]